MVNEREWEYKMLHEKTMQDIEDELVRQNRKWGTQDHDDMLWLAILLEEIGEVSKDIIEMRPEKDVLIELELIHTISVAVNWLQRRRVNRGL